MDDVFFNADLPYIQLIRDSRHSCQIYAPDYHAPISKAGKPDNRDRRTRRNNDTLTPGVGLLQREHVSDSRIADVDPLVQVEQFLL